MVEKTIENDEFKRSYKKNLKIINYTTKRFNKVIPYEELKSIKMIGLWNALRKYDIDRGTKFSYFLFINICWLCYSYIRDKVKIREYNNVKSLDILCRNKYENMELRRVVVENELDMVIQKFYYNRTYDEIGKMHNFSRQTTCNRLKEELNLIANLYGV